MYLLQRDSIFGRFPRALKLHKDRLILGGSGVDENGVGENDCREIIFSHFSHPKDSTFSDVDVVLETSGAFLECESLGLFLQNDLQNGVQKVILGASPKDEMPIFVRGVNEKSYAGEKIISNASCTSNAIAPIIAAISRKHRILRAAVTIIHPFNSDQRLLDSPHAADFRLSRSAHANIIPTKSSICAVLERLFPRVRFAGDSLRVPSQIVCFGLLDLTLDSPMTRAEFLGLEWDKNIVGFTGELCVSSDFVGDLRSAVIDCESLRCEGANCRLGVWFDNESAYAARMIEMAGVMGVKIAIAATRGKTPNSVPRYLTR